MKLRSVLVIAALACGCQKSSNSGTGTASDNNAPAPPPTASGNGAAPSDQAVPSRQVQALPAEPVAKEPAPPPEPTPSSSADNVRPPVAADLAEYTKGLPGTGALQATIETSLGTIHCTLYGDKVPMTVANFVGLATGKKAWQDPSSGETVKGKPFFDGLTFHRVIPEFMSQTGDPMGTGMGGPGYNFENEPKPDLLYDKAGVMGMANAGPGTNGSQFFITEVPKPDLNGGYTVFGQCDPAGVAVVKKINRVKTDPNDKPLTPVLMKKVTISRAAK
jgi:peptidyl-prolyl cis-trans isomerase A (cyclophilin A)